MSGRRILCVGVAILFVVTSRAQAQRGGVHQASWHGGHGGGGHHGSHGYHGPQVIGFGGGGFYGAFPPILAIGPGVFMPPVGWMSPVFTPAPGPLLPPPPAGMVAPDRRPNLNRANLKPGDPVRSGQLTTLGD